MDGTLPIPRVAAVWGGGAAILGKGTVQGATAAEPQTSYKHTANIHAVAVPGSGSALVLAWEATAWLGGLLRHDYRHKLNLFPILLGLRDLQDREKGCSGPPRRLPD